MEGGGIIQICRHTSGVHRHALLGKFERCPEMARNFFNNSNHGHILYEYVAALACESLKLRWSSKNGKIAPISKCLR